MTTYTISEDQNTLTSSDGEVFKAIFNKPCGGCQFHWSNCPEADGSYSSFCSSAQRDDRQNIIWVKEKYSKPRPFNEWMQEAMTIRIPEKYFQYAAIAYKAGQDSMKEGK